MKLLYVIFFSILNIHSTKTFTESGACRGDSGGGLFVKLGSPHFGRQYGLLGLVSRGLMTKLTDENGTEYKTCDVSKPSVFTNLSKYNEWISDHITLPALEEKYINFINKFRKIIETEKLHNAVLHFNADLYIKNL